MNLNVRGGNGYRLVDYRGQRRTRMLVFDELLLSKHVQYGS